ncbi:pumilio homolog 5-like [Cornus florida]|uniref:pumilio homolog 5-like n=1 Tax=Cornus florida TaxID=4283 RepID=UPI00289EE504|nr:pumilio homolog 5-like [Cornus florida]XP_059636933.1 pumilio homolog 5-like [Cornus florida]XP_059636934.1 pumilio homolog 5-like [Cornus florida]XP_059636935.1 pumilio homolog 5-like [Cornus florida]XP_059636936.1 pumilio homolog 5-like [Cornus florida]
MKFAVNTTEGANCSSSKMATESPIRIIETSGKWLPHKEAAMFGRSSSNMDTEELGSKGERFLGNGRDVVPNRSESAPPSVEGSFAAIENLMSLRDSSLNPRFGSFVSEQFRADPAYLPYHCSNVTLNPRLPPPPTSLENRRLVHHIGNWNLTSVDDSDNGSLPLSQSNLPTHEEEFDDRRSTQQAYDDCADRSSGFCTGHDAALSGKRKSSVDWLQKDDTHTSPPVYNQPGSFSHGLVEEAVYCDSDTSSLHNHSVGKANTIKFTPSADNMGLSSNVNYPTAPVSSSPSLDNTEDTPVMPPLYIRHSNTIDVHLEDEVSISGVSDSDVTRIESEMKAINVSGLPNPECHKHQKDQRHDRQNNVLQQPARQQQSHTFEVQGGMSNIFSQGANPTYIGTNQLIHGPSNFSSAEAQPILQSSGLSPSLYAAAASYMTSLNPIYPNLQPSGYFSPQYNVGGYVLNTTALPPFVAGYGPHSANIPVPFDGAAGLGFSARTFGISSRGSAADGVDVQDLNKFYGQLGFAMQPSFTDPLHLQYFQQPFRDAYGVSSQFDPLVSRDMVMGNQVSNFDLQRGADLTACSVDQKLQHQGSGGPSNLNPRRGGIISPYYFGSPKSTGPFMQYPISPVASPVLPGSPVGGTNFPGGRNEVRFPPVSGRNAGIYSGWQGQGGFEIFDDTRTHSFLEELRSGKGRKFELIDIAGHIIEFSADQHGSRFIQQKLENCSVEEKASVFKEVLPHASKLMTDVFGNYVIQKFFEYGSPEQRKELANKLEGQILPLSLQMYGCRVIQKALEVIEPEQKTKLVRELDGHVTRCVRDQNGNHVIQKCIESIPTDKIGFIISAFRGHVATLSTHPYGCRVIQRVLEHCADQLQSQFIVDEILESVCDLAQDQYGNYVTQHVLERGKLNERSKIINKLSGHIVQMSQHKFASNVVEKCLEYGDSTSKEILIGEIIGQNDANDCLLAMMKDQYANYVIQKILKTCTDNQREMLLSRISLHLNALKKYTYGKHIAARFEQLYGEEIQTPGS